MQNETVGVTTTRTSDHVVMTTRPPNGLGIITVGVGLVFALFALFLGWKSGMGFETWLLFGLGVLIVLSGLPMLFLTLTVTVSLEEVSARSTLSMRCRPVAIPRSEITAVYLQRLTRSIRTGRTSTTDAITNNLFLVLASGDDTLLMQSPNLNRVQVIGREVCRALGLSDEEVNDPLEERDDEGRIV